MSDWSEKRKIQRKSTWLCGISICLLILLCFQTSIDWKLEQTFPTFNWFRSCNWMLQIYQIILGIALNKSNFTWIQFINFSVIFSICAVFDVFPSAFLFIYLFIDCILSKTWAFAFDEFFISWSSSNRQGQLSIEIYAFSLQLVHVNFNAKI